MILTSQRLSWNPLVGTVPASPAPMERVKMGVEGLDAMLSGGLVPARPYVISGPTGSGKTILALHFLLEGLKRNEPCLLVTVD